MTKQINDARAEFKQSESSDPSQAQRESMDSNSTGLFEDRYDNHISESNRSLERDSNENSTGDYDF